MQHHRDIKLRHKGIRLRGEDSRRRHEASAIQLCDECRLGITAVVVTGGRGARERALVHASGVGRDGASCTSPGALP